MKFTSTITDNITEVLIKIIEFTKIRQQILIRNIKNMHIPGFVPLDIAVDEFSSQMHQAINEHTQNRRLVLCDTQNIKFGPAGRFEVKPLTDGYANQLLNENPDQYLKMQTNKLLENSINQRVASELLRQKEGLAPILE